MLERTALSWGRGLVVCGSAVWGREGCWLKREADPGLCQALSSCHTALALPDLFSSGQDVMYTSQNKSQSHPKPGVTGAGTFLGAASQPATKPATHQGSKLFASQMTHKHLRTSRLAADWPPCLGWPCQTL